MNTTDALLITSAQNDLLAPGGKAWEMVRTTVEHTHVSSRLARLLRAARAAGVPVIHSPVGFDFDALAASGAGPLTAIGSVIFQHRLLALGSDGAEIVPEAAPAPGEVVLPPRQGFSAFWEGTLRPELERLGTRRLIVAGMLAEGCVSAHARDAAENGYRPVVVCDAIGATSPELLDASLATVGLHCEGVMTTDEVAASFTR